MGAEVAGGTAKAEAGAAPSPALAHPERYDGAGAIHRAHPRGVREGGTAAGRAAVRHHAEQHPARPVRPLRRSSRPPPLPDGGKLLRPLLVLLSARAVGEISPGIVSCARPRRGGRGADPHRIPCPRRHGGRLRGARGACRACTWRTAPPRRCSSATCSTHASSRRSPPCRDACPRFACGCWRGSSRVTARMCEGEILEDQMRAEGIAPSFEAYLHITETKTADLVSACCRAGALLNGAPRARGGGPGRVRPRPRAPVPDRRRPCGRRRGLHQPAAPGRSRRRNAAGPRSRSSAACRATRPRPRCAELPGHILSPSLPPIGPPCPRCSAGHAGLRALLFDHAVDTGHRSPGEHRPVSPRRRDPARGALRPPRVGTPAGLGARGLRAPLAAFLVAVAGWGMPAGAAVSAGLQGAATALFPIIWIVVSALWVHSLAVASGQFEVIRRSLASITGDRRLQALFIAFAFGAFLEGAGRLRHARGDLGGHARGPGVRSAGSRRALPDRQQRTRGLRRGGDSRGGGRGCERDRRGHPRHGSSATRCRCCPSSSRSGSCVVLCGWKRTWKSSRPCSWRGCSCQSRSSSSRSSAGRGPRASSRAS